MTLREYLKDIQSTIAEFSFQIDYTRSHINNIMLGKSRASSKLKNKIFKFTQGKVNL
jgi:hypothetical protein